MMNELHNAVGGGLCEYGSEQFSHQPETAPEPVHGVIGAHHRGCSSTYSVASYTLGLIHNVFGQILPRLQAVPADKSFSSTPNQSRGGLGRPGLVQSSGRFSRLVTSSTPTSEFLF